MNGAAPRDATLYGGERDPVPIPQEVLPLPAVSGMFDDDARPDTEKNCTADWYDERTCMAPDNIVVLACPECGVRVGIDAAFYRMRRLQQRTIGCPNGHPVDVAMWANGPLLVEQIEAQANEIADLKGQLAHAQRQIGGFKAQLALKANSPAPQPDVTRVVFAALENVHYTANDGGNKIMGNVRKAIEAALVGAGEAAR